MHSTNPLTVLALMGTITQVFCIPAAYLNPPRIDTLTLPTTPTLSTPPNAAPPDLAPRALGSLLLRDYCTYTVYLYVCKSSTGCTAQTTLAPSTGVWSAPYPSIDNEGVSLKVGPNSRAPGTPDNNILQFEYTKQRDTVYFNVVPFGNAFGAGGYSLTTTAGLKAYCAPPGTYCPAVWKAYSMYSGDSVALSLCRKV